MTIPTPKTAAPVAAKPHVGSPRTLGRVGTWELLELAGEGTLSRVYRARPHDPGDDRPAAYALKVLRSEWSEDSRAIALLQREASLGRSVSHPHLISVLASSVRTSPGYLVMPWLHGHNLAWHLSGGKRLDQPQSYWIARQIAEAMEALATAGWMHGDLKPTNVFLSPEGHVTLLDLGFARRIDRPDPAIERFVTGTVRYMAPEALGRGHRIELRSDLYSLGVLLFEMLAGCPPFLGNDATETARQHREARPPKLSSLVPQLHSDGETLVSELLAKQPLRRPQSPREIIDRLIALEIGTFNCRA